MRFKNNYILSSKDMKEAYDYLYKSNDNNTKTNSEKKQENLYNKKISEKILEEFLKENKVKYEKYNEKFKLLNGKIIDTKVRTGNFYNKILEPINAIMESDTDIYILIKVNTDKKSGSLLGWIYKEDIKKLNRIEKTGKIEKYVIHDDELRPIRSLYNVELDSM